MKNFVKIIFFIFIFLISAMCKNKVNYTKDSEKEEKVEEHTQITAKKEKTDRYTVAEKNTGVRQSPINILSYNTKPEGKKRKVILNFQDKINAVENLGHTVQLNFSKGSTITANGKTYQFKQLHFHTPSEHLIDGITYPMEMHIVSTLEIKNQTTQYLVIGVLFKMGKENKFINEFINLIPKKKHTKSEVSPGVVKLKDLLFGKIDKKLKKYYHYRGSLTTSPYTETVEWYVLKQIYEASPEQIKRLNVIEGDNARHIQALHGREIIE